ncbi:MAG: ribulose-phosphate 3-epimerase [Clostridia bacterium]|nr:ribulose-phosphate 3-epimerase [Clostridia bacterium]
MRKLLSASMMCADLTNIEKDVRKLEAAGIEYLHIDIMDGSFVPNITLGFDFVNAIKAITDIPLDVHMMVDNPARFIDRMKLDKGDVICIHYEADNDAAGTLARIREHGCQAGLAINPTTPLTCLEGFIDDIDMALIMTVTPGFAGQKMFDGAQQKVTEARKLLSTADRYIPIEVDGNMSPENGKKLSAAGADIFVLGTSGLFIKNKDMTVSAEEFRAAIAE